MSVIKEQWRTYHNPLMECTFIAYRLSSHSKQTSILHPMFRYFIIQYVYNDDLLHYSKLNNPNFK